MPRRLRVLIAVMLALGACMQLGALQARAEEGSSLAVAEVYVDGTAGDDANPGTREAPVRTFERARELMQRDGAEAIRVTGALQVSGTAEAWELGGKALRRDAGYHGELVHLSRSASLTLGEVVLDGDADGGATGVSTNGDGSGGSLVGVFDGSTLTVGEGAVLEDNRVESRGSWYPEAGGAVFASHGTVRVEGGAIRGNEAVYGGGIHGAYGSLIDVSAGSIQDNRAVEGASANLDPSYGGCGGGICATDGADVNLSGGTISGNSAAERGGGVSMGTHFAPAKDSPTLTMTGGTIQGNSAGAAGGGIFLQAGYSASGNNGTPTYAVARITTGDITGNSVTGEGNGSTMFGGGGIYVNGYSSEYDSFHNGELYLEDVEVSHNSAPIAGAGYAACPVSVTEVNLTDGSAIFSNTTDAGNAREIYVLSSLSLGTHSGSPSYEVSPSMLGGGAYRWKYDDGTEVPLGALKGTLDASQGESLSLSCDLADDSPEVERARALARVHVTGNSSPTRGGGIGSNGNVFVGTPSEKTEVRVTKAWDDDGDASGLRPSSVTVELYRDGTYVGYRTLAAGDDGSWSATFDNLPKADASGHEYAYTVREREVAGYVATVTGDAATGFTITNAPAPKTTSVSVAKVWDDQDDKDGARPASVRVQLLADGEPAGDPVELDAAGGWAHTWDDLPKEKDGAEVSYAVREVDVPAGYAVSVTGDAASGFTVTNTRATPPDQPGGDTPGGDNPGGDNPGGDTPASPTVVVARLLPRTGEKDALPGALATLAAGLAIAGTALALRRR